MFNRTPNMTELSGLTVQLDDLHKSYATLFAEAQRQLEAIDLTDGHIARLSDKVIKNDQLVRNIQASCIAQLANILREVTDDELEQEYSTRRLLGALEERLWKRIEAQVTQHISTIVDAKVNETIDAAVTAALNGNEKVQRGLSAEFVLTGLYAYLKNVERKDTTEESNEAAG